MAKKERYTLEYLHELFSVYYSEKKEIITSFSLLAEISPIDPEYQSVKEKVKSHIEKLRHSVSMTQEVLKNYSYVPGLGIDNSAQNEAKRFERLLDEFLVLMEHETMTMGDEENWFDALGVRTFENRWEKFLSAVGATYFFKSARKAARVSRINSEKAKKQRGDENSRIRIVEKHCKPHLKVQEIYSALYSDLEEWLCPGNEDKKCKEIINDNSGDLPGEPELWRYRYRNEKDKWETVDLAYIRRIKSRIKKASS